MLNFMYHGEVNVAQDSLNNFLAVAEELAVKGLTTDSKPPTTGPDTPAKKAVAAKRKTSLPPGNYIILNFLKAQIFIHFGNFFFISPFKSFFK